MYNNLLLETRQPLSCQRCSGQLLRSDDEISCLQCGAPHTKEGKLAIYSVQEFILMQNVLSGISNKFKEKTAFR
ncbi:hypothetical protein ES707_22470 [subsurface metagenome]